MSILAQIQQSVQEIAEAIAAAIGAELDILDQDLVRVASTLVELKGKKIVTTGIVYRDAMRTGRHFVLENPGHEDICKQCIWHEKCKYRLVIYAPIMLDSQGIGVISLYAFEQSQKDKLISRNIDVLLNFTHMMAGLISSKVKEQEMLENALIMANQLNAVLNSVEQAVIALDEKGVITHLNTVAHTMGLSKQCIGSHLKGILSGTCLHEVLVSGKAVTMPETITLPNRRTKRFITTARPIIANDRLVGVVGHFKDYNEAQKEAVNFFAGSRLVFLQDIIGSSSVMTELKEKIQKIASTNSTILLIGETGTGKELFARAVHAEGERKNRPFISVNCGALPETLIESEFFGYESGAFTGAKKTGKPGKFEQAQCGTIFLDEIEAIPIYLQHKLLRVIQEREVERVGGIESIKIDVRIVAASNENVEELVKKGRFRADLFHRLNVVPLRIPPLRERGADVYLLADYFVGKYALLMKKKISGLTAEAKEFLSSYSWPGNVRELENAIEYAVNFEDNEYISMKNLPFAIATKEKLEKNSSNTIIDIEKQAVVNALKMFGFDNWGKEQAAQHLGISRSTIFRKIKKYDIQPVDL
jgi:sigma-54 dependent transcriptional regulator, acetoin dehydrogenase operon transcriptional activator AcoR